MAQGLTIRERAQQASRYEGWQSVIQVQRWWRTMHGSRARVDPKIVNNNHSTLMNMGSVADTGRRGQPVTSAIDRLLIDGLGFHCSTRSVHGPPPSLHLYHGLPYFVTGGLLSSLTQCQVLRQF